MNETTMEFPLQLLFTLLALVVVLVLAWFSIRFLASLNKSKLGTSRPIKILHTTSLGSRERLVLVNYEGREILLGVTAGGICVVDKSSTKPSLQTQLDETYDKAHNDEETNAHR